MPPPQDAHWCPLKQRMMLHLPGVPALPQMPLCDLPVAPHSASEWSAQDQALAIVPGVKEEAGFKQPPHPHPSQVVGQLGSRSPPLTQPCVPGERPFVCLICLSAFTTKANCERHLKVHTDTLSGR